MPFENFVGRAQIIFFSVARGRARLADLALAVVGALEPPVHDRAMSRGAKPDEAHKAGATRQRERAVEPRRTPKSRKPLAPAKAAQRAPRKRAVAATALEKTIGYRFKDAICSSAR